MLVGKRITPSIPRVEFLVILWRCGMKANRRASGFRNLAFAGASPARATIIDNNPPYCHNTVMRNIRKMQTRNDGTRSLVESIMAPEVISALRDWVASSNSQGVLIGGLAFSHYGKPRYTQDVDLLYMSEEDIPAQVLGFKRIRGHAFEDRKRGIEIEVLSPTFLNISHTLVHQVFATAIESDGVRIASPSAIIALKLGRLSPQDRADIIDLIQHEDIDLAGFGLTQDQMAKYIALVAEADQPIAELPREEPWEE